MKFALINGSKAEATKGTIGFCPWCKSELIAKCGDVKVHHWSHKGTRMCDTWWENETEWHRDWKNQFPVDWQEVIQFDKNGEKHIADVKTESGYVLEFQHSFLNPEERISRNSFYPKLVWVVDGTRRKTDNAQFQQVLDDSTKLPSKIPILKVRFPEECRLLKEWHENNALVFFDFQKSEQSENSILWFLFPKMLSNEVFLSFLPKAKFIELHNTNTFDELVNNSIIPIQDVLENRIKTRVKNIKINPLDTVQRVRQKRSIMRRRQRRF